MQIKVRTNILELTYILVSSHLKQISIICFQRKRDIREFIQNKLGIRASVKSPKFLKTLGKRQVHPALWLRQILLLGMPSVWLLQKTAVLLLLCINTGTYLVLEWAGPGTDESVFTCAGLWEVMARCKKWDYAIQQQVAIRAT